jgi:UDP-N-acetylmuramate--alanine ligase
MRGRKLHFIAIGGAGMSGLALVCHRLGAAVTGSDRAESSYLDRLRAVGLEPRLGHDPQAVPPDAEVVVSSAIREENPELRRARERGQPVLHRGELLAELCASRRLIAVAGTHGKTTTAGMLAYVLRALGEDPAFFLGGELPGVGSTGEAANAGWGEGEWAVAEADESDASFLRLRPEVAVVTNVELDHHSHWSSRAELLDAFRRFAEPATGLALLDHPALDSIVSGQRTLRFGASALPPPLRAGRANGWEGPAELGLTLPGEHNRLNALAALAAVELAGFGVEAATAELAGFPGMLRRLERKGERHGAAIFDDYAHHPTEVAAALAALRELDPRRLIAVFQPHLYSRTKALAPRFGQALAAADEIGVLDVYPAREEPVGPLAGVSGLAVAEAAAECAGGKPVWWLRDAERAERALGPRLREGDVLVTLGAGDIYELASRLVDEPPRDGSSAAPAEPSGSLEASA